MQHGHDWFIKKSLEYVVPGLKWTSTYMHVCCGTWGRLGIPASVDQGVLGPVPWPATKLPEAAWLPRSLTQTHIPCIQVSSVQNPCWLMISSGIVLPNMLGITIIQYNPRTGNLYKPSSHGMIQGFCGHCSSGVASSTPGIPADYSAILRSSMICEVILEHEKLTYHLFTLP